MQQGTDGHTDGRGQYTFCLDYASHAPPFSYTYTKMNLSTVKWAQ